jgi:hypothetical protein
VPESDLEASANPGFAHGGDLTGWRRKPSGTPSMSIFRDIRSAALLHAKGFLFLVMGLLAFAGVLLETPTLRVALLLVIGTWGFCRFYYYLFHVLEHYAGRGKPYAGVVDALRHVITRRNEE